MRALATVLVCAAVLAGAPPAAAAPGARLVARAAWHRGTVAGAVITWHSRVAVNPPGADGTARLDLAVPLPADVRLLPGAAGSAAAVRDEGGRIVAFDVAVPAAATSVTLALAQPWGPTPGRAHLAAPLVAGGGAQELDLRGDDDPEYDPAPGLGIERHVGYSAPRDVDAAARAACGRLAGPPGDQAGAGDEGEAADAADAPRAWPVFVRADARLVALGGLEGRVRTRAERSRPAALAAGLAFAALTLGLAAAWRRLRGAAELEQAEAVIRSEYDALDGR